MRIKYLLPVLLAASLSTAAFANPFETTLKNGLRIIVKEDHRAPTAVQMVWYRIGSIDEVDGHSGVAHVLEHMMFKGTPSVGPGEFNKRVAGLLHAVAAFVLVLGFIVHVYAALWVKGTLHAMVRGTVSGGWAKHHHPQWYREQMQGQAATKVPRK